MVQKVTNYTGNFPIGLNFQPTTISGLNVSHTGGVVAGVGDIVETVAGALVVPDNIAWTAYVDTIDGVLKAIATASLPTANLQIVWDGVSGGGSVTSFRDVRSWTSTANTVKPSEKSFETQILALAPDHWWKMNDSATPLADSGTATARTGAEISTPEHYNMPAYTSETRTVHFDGTTDGFDLSGTVAPSATTGTILFLFKTNTPSTRCIFHLGDNTAGPTSEFSINLTGSGGFVIDIVKDGSNNSSWTGGSGFNDGLWHLGILRQTGAAVILHVDNASVAISRADNGDAEDTDWISYVTQVAAGGSIGCRRLDITNHDLFWDSFISNVAVWDNVILTTQDITNLQSALQLTFWSYLNKQLAPEFNFWFGGASTSPAYNMGTKDPVTDLALGSATVFNYQRPGNAGGTDTNARMSIGQGFLESGADTGPELGGTSFGTLIFAFQGKHTDESKLFNEFGPFQSGASAGAGGHYTTGVTAGGQPIYFADDGFPGSAQNDTRLFTAVDADNGLFNLAVIVKNDDANAPDYYWNGVLQTTFTDENSTNSLETWWDDHIEGDEWAFGQDINAGGAYSAGTILEHMAAVEGVAITQAQVSELNLRYILERGSQSMEDICLAAGPSHYWPLTESGTTLFDIGYSCREGLASAVRSRHNIDIEDGAGSVTYQVTGPEGNDKAVSFSAAQARLQSSTMDTLASDSAGEGGAVGVFFKTGNTTTLKHIWDAGNNGGALNHRIRIQTNGDLTFQLRDGGGTGDIKWTYVDAGSLDDDNWHFVYWQCDGTDWLIRVDGVEYTDADTEVTEAITGAYTQVDWWGILATIDRAAFGNSSGTSFAQTLDGELAHPMVWRENDGANTNLPTLAAIQRIEAKAGF